MTLLSPSLRDRTASHDDKKQTPNSVLKFNPCLEVKMKTLPSYLWKGGMEKERKKEERERGLAYAEADRLSSTDKYHIWK